MLGAGFSSLCRCQKLGFSAWVLSPFSKDVSTERFIFTGGVWVVPGEGMIKAWAVSVGSHSLALFLPHQTLLISVKEGCVVLLLGHCTPS